jgi:hypothetical protein
VRALWMAAWLAGFVLFGAHALAQPAQAQYSADELYNLANAYARAGKPGLAVLNYERAALLAPGDADIEANMRLVRAAAHVAVPPRSRFARIVEAASPTAVAWAGVLGIALAGAGMLARRAAPRVRWPHIGAVCVGTVLVAWTVSAAVLFRPRMHDAVVLGGSTPARVSPVPMGDTAFLLPEAETVTIIAIHDDFALVRTRGGVAGWVARANIGAVLPRDELGSR